MAIALFCCFSIDNNRWDTGQLESNCIQGSRQIIGGKYKLEFEAKEGCVSWEYPDISTVSNFYITVDAEQLSGSISGAYGLVLRNTGSNYYFFSSEMTVLFISKDFMQTITTLLLKG